MNNGDGYIVWYANPYDGTDMEAHFDTLEEVREYLKVRKAKGRDMWHYLVTSKEIELSTFM